MKPWLLLEYKRDRHEASKSATDECWNGLLGHIGSILLIWLLLFLWYVCIYLYLRVCVCVCTVRLSAMRTPCFLGDHHRLRPAPCLRSWPGNPRKQGATCCLSQERPSLLLLMGRYSSQLKVNHTVHPDYTTATHTETTQYSTKTDKLYKGQYKGRTVQ